MYVTIINTKNYRTIWVVNSRFLQASKKLADCTAIVRLLARLEVLVGRLADP